MGNAQPGVLDDRLAVEEEVDIDGSRGFGRARWAHPPMGALYVQTRLQEWVRRKLCFESHHRVEIPRLVRPTFGLGFVKGAKRGKVAKLGQRLDGQRDLGASVTEVRPQTKIGNHGGQLTRTLAPGAW